MREPIDRRRVLFNCDGHSVWVDAQGDLDRWVGNLFTGLVGTHVDALLWCDGAGGNTANYDSRVLERTGARAGKVDPHLERSIAAGQDPPRIAVEEGHRRGLDVLYSFRINDCHDAFMPEELPTFKVDHPEWQIGKAAAYGPHTALDFAHPEVRDLKLRTVEELFDRYDFDGIEIDLLRGPPFFTPHLEPRHSYLLTDLLRQVRGLLDRRAAQRGRRVEVAVRVDESLAACRLDGFDVAAWIAPQDLLDTLILGSGVLDIDVEGFRQAAAGTGVRIYPCLYGWPAGYSPASPELVRGLAATYWDQGADGIYLFNWFPHQEKFAFQVALLSQIGDPAALGGLPVMFAAERGFAARPDDYYPHNGLGAKLPAPLWPSQTALEVPLRAGARLVGHAELRLEVKGCAGEALEARLNGEPMALVAGAEPGWWVAAIDGGAVARGVNRVEVRLRGRLPDGGPPLVRSAEIHGTMA